MLGGSLKLIYSLSVGVSSLTCAHRDDRIGKGCEAIVGASACSECS